MKQITWIVLGWLTLSSMAQAASFDCGKASSNIEKLICSDQELSKLDDDLGSAYSAARTNSKPRSDITIEQRRWLRDLNICRDRYCIKNSYVARLQSLLSNQQPAQSVEAGPPWVFSLTQGGDLPVCRAYLERLNHGKQADYPFCDRPETGEEYGFTPLVRKPLSNEKIHELAPLVEGFMRSRNQDSRFIQNASELKRKQKLTEPLSPSSISQYVGKDIFVWKYEPHVDIDNDGQPDQIIVWRGIPVGNHLPGCGSTDYRFGGVMSDTQMSFIVDTSISRVDAFNTSKVFGHPLDYYSLYNSATQTWVLANDFWPIGEAIGIFKFEGKYYFDTFLSLRGDFKGARQNDPKINSSLGVFIHQNDETKQVCEYYWRNNPNEQQ